MKAAELEVGDLVAVAILRGRRQVLVHLPVIEVARRRVAVRLDEQRVWINPARASVVRRARP